MLVGHIQYIENLRKRLTSLRDEGILPADNLQTQASISTPPWIFFSIRSSLQGCGLTKEANYLSSRIMTLKEVGGFKEIMAKEEELIFVIINLYHHCHV